MTDPAGWDGNETQWSGELPPRCPTCAGAGTVWARAGALPIGFLRFCGASLPHSEDRKYVEIVCPTCDGGRLHGRQAPPDPRP